MSKWIIPKYKCHKEVQALKIKEVIFGTGDTVTLMSDDCNPLSVDDSYVLKHNPKVGGYYVRYGDGYESYSPAEAFEAGYTRLT